MLGCRQIGTIFGDHFPTLSPQRLRVNRAVKPLRHDPHPGRFHLIVQGIDIAMHRIIFLNRGIIVISVVDRDENFHTANDTPRSRAVDVFGSETVEADALNQRSRAPRLGLCCQFLDEPVKFRTTTAAALSKLGEEARRQRLSELCLANAEALISAVESCALLGIGAFRINSQIMPLRTHPDVGYNTAKLPLASSIESSFRRAGELARSEDIRLTFHPDQFVVLNSPNPKVVQSSLAELNYQAEVANWVGADVLNLHGGGAYGDKKKALDDLERAIEALPDQVRRRLTLENDDKIFTPKNLIGVCRRTQTPLVYDVHHHRCLPDGWSIAEATDAAFSTWNREPLFHISSPREGWNGPKPERHHDFIDPQDFPSEWLGGQFTIDVEAKAKERAVLQLMQALESGVAVTSV